MANNKTILLIRNAAQSDFGGAETYPVSLATILKKQGYKPVVVTRSAKLLAYAKKQRITTLRGWWWKKQNWTGKSTFIIPVYIVWQLILTGWYVAAIGKTKASAVHIQSKDDFIAATLAARITGKKAIWTDHMDLRYIFENIEHPLRNLPGKLVAWAGRFAHHIIIISDNEYRLVTKHFAKHDRIMSRFVIVKNGVSDYPPRRRPQRDQDDVSFCLASRIIENKGIGESIDAFTTLQGALPHQKLTLNIYGDGPELARYTALAHNNPAIVFHGHQDNPLDAILKNDIFMLPSYQEGFSIALLEATMLGMPIIASDVDSNSEIVQHETTGLLVAAKDARDLTRAMERLATDKGLRHSIGRAARVSYEKNFNLETIVTTAIIPLYS